MKLNKRYRFILIFCGVILSICAIIGVKSAAQSLEGYVVEGESFDGIIIGESTADDVIANYGEGYKLINHNQYSYEMIYKNLGLSFYYCQADPNKEIFVVEIEPPFRATTKNGIVLGESTVADVFRIYGTTDTSSDGFEYEGIYFYAEEDDSGEEQDDARIQPQIVENTESTDNESENTDGFVIDGASGAESSFVIDKQEVSNEPVGELNQANNLKENESDEVVEEESGIQTLQANENVQESEKERALKARVVKRIELIEKDGLRQCDSKFPRN